MTPRVRAVMGVSLMSALLLLYFFFAGYKAIVLLGSGDALAMVIGAALIVFPIIGVWALVREVLFGVRSTQLLDELERTGELPEELVDIDVPRPEVRAIADQAFESYREAAQAQPERWQAFMRLGLVYDAAGDRKRARSAIRQAISLKK